MACELYLGIDLGTTAVKVGLFDAEGRALAVAVREFQFETPAPGFAEFDADRYVGCAFDGIREVLGAGGVDAASVQAIGLSSQAQTFVVLDKDGRPLRPAVGWLDVRAGAEAKELSEISAGQGGEPIDAISSGPKLLWLRRHEPDVMARCRRVLLIPDYLIFRLTGQAATDPVTAWSTGMHDGYRGPWIEELLDACGLTREMMPAILSPGEPAGKLTAEAARELGLPETTLVAVGTNDQTVGAVGAGNVTPGSASVTLGTALAIVVTSDRTDRVPRGIFAGPHAVKGLYTLLAYAKTAGVVLRWFRDHFAPSLSYDELFEEIATVPIGAGGISCLPHFSGTASPTFNPAVRGAFSGLTLAHGRADLARALVESLVFVTRQNLELVGPVVGGVKELRAIGGGSKSDVWLQMMADATGLAVERPATGEAACLGAAELAMVAAGRFPSVGEVSRALYRPERRFEPDPTRKAAYDQALARHEALYQALYGGQEEEIGDG